MSDYVGLRRPRRSFLPVPQMTDVPGNRLDCHEMEPEPPKPIGHLALISTPGWATVNHLVLYNNNIVKMRHWLYDNQEELEQDNKPLFLNYRQILFTQEANRLQFLIGYCPSAKLLKRFLRQAIYHFKLQLLNTRTYIDDSEWFPRQRIPLSAFQGEPCLVYPEGTSDEPFNHISDFI